MLNTSYATLSTGTGPPLPGPFLPTSGISHVDVNPMNGTVESILTHPTPARLPADNVVAGQISTQTGHQLNSPSRSEITKSKRSKHAVQNIRQVSYNRCLEVRNRELPTGKSLIDMYSKRSASLVHKGEELAHLTHAYVVVFAARPESIGEGNRRLYLSDEFKDADPDLAARINKVTQELNDIAVELAHRAGWEVQSRKKRRSDSSNKSPEVSDRSTPCTSSTSISSTQNQTLTQRPNHIATPNPAENLTPVPTKETALVTAPPMSKLLGMDRNKIESFVRALIKLPPDEDNLDVLHDIAQSEIGVKVIESAKAIPFLIDLLNKDPLPLACRSALILTSMMQYWMACTAILDAGAAVPVIRLLSRDIGSEILNSIAHAFGHCIPWCPDQFRFFERPTIPADDLDELATLLRTGNMEVRLATAQIIWGLTSAEFIKYDCDRGRSMALDLCRLALDCRDLSEKELVMSAIDTIRMTISFTPEIHEIMKSQILPPVIRLLDMTATDAETAIAACRILRKPMILKDKLADKFLILNELVELMFDPDDEVFVEAAWTASVLRCRDCWHTNLPVDCHSDTMQRLTRLFHHHKEHVVVCVLRSIADAPDLENVLLDFFLEIFDEGEVGHIINLLQSGNLALAEAALLFIYSIQRLNSKAYPPRRSLLQYFQKHGIIQALLRNLACDSSPLFQRTAYVINSFMVEMKMSKVESTAYDLDDLLPSLENRAKMVVISLLDWPLDLDVYITLDTSIPRFLLQLGQDAMISLRFLRIILKFIGHVELHEEFRAAGAESFLDDPRLRSRLTELHGGGSYEQNRLQQALDVLRVRYTRLSMRRI